MQHERWIGFAGLKKTLLKQNVPKRPSNHEKYDCTDNTRISSPVVLNNKTRYIRYRICGWLVMDKQPTRAKALGVGARGRSGYDGELRRVGARKQRGIAKHKMKTGCVC